MEFKVGKATLQLTKGDITETEVDAIVNAANSSLMGGGGVDGAIHHKGGPKILEECKKIRESQWPDGLPTGKAVITTGGKLKARSVIHTVGPVWMGGFNVEAELLKQAYRNSMKLAVSSGVRSIAFPSISTGAFRYPVEEASNIAIAAVISFLENEDELEKVIFVLHSDKDFNVYLKTAEKQLT